MYNPYQPTWINQYSGYQTPLMSQQQYQQPVNGIIKVNGAQSAMQYNLPPNSTSPALFDVSGTCFYVVSTDGTGTKTLETFDFTQRVEQHPVPNNDYVSRSEFDSLVEKVSHMMESLNGSNAAVPTA